MLVSGLTPDGMSVSPTPCMTRPTDIVHAPLDVPSWWLLLSGLKEVLSMVAASIPTLAALMMLPTEQSILRGVLISTPGYFNVTTCRHIAGKP